MSVQSWQIGCPRCGWSNSGAERRCTKCGQPLRTAPGLLVAGMSAGQTAAPKAPPVRVVQPGGFFPRLIAVIIDACILSVVLVPIYYFWLGALTPAHLDPGAQANPFVDQVRALGGSALAGFTQEQLLSIAGFYIGAAVLQLFYFVGTWSILGGSPGQLVMSLRLVDKTARGIGFGRALMRYIWKALFGWLALVSALMVAIGKEKRAIHDLLAGTYVIQFLDQTVAVDDPGLPPVQAGAPTPTANAGAGAAAAAPAMATAVSAPAPAAAPAPPLAPVAAAAVPSPAAAPAPAAPVPPAHPAFAPATASASAIAASGSSFQRYAPAADATAAPATPVATQPAANPNPAPSVAAPLPPPFAPAPLPPPFAPSPLPPPFAPAAAPPQIATAAPAPELPTAAIPDSAAPSAPAEAAPTPAPAVVAPALQATPSPSPIAPSPGLYQPPPMAIPSLPPPTPAPMSAPPYQEIPDPAPHPVEATPRRAAAEPPVDPYPLPFAPLPPVVHPPAAPAAADQRRD